MGVKARSFGLNRAMENLADSGVKSVQFGGLELGRDPLRMQPRCEKNFIRINIPDSRENFLVHEGRLN